MQKKFLRADSFRYSKLGKNRKKLQKWRGAKGIQNKLRLRRAGHPSKPLVGFRKDKTVSGRISGLIPVLIRNSKDLDSVTKGNIAIISSRLGAKKRLEIIKKANSMKIKMFNVEGAK